jgi:hypothetical protein
MLATIESVSARVGEGRRLIVAGDEEMLRRLPPGPWIGGTTSYFMSAQGGVTSRDRLFAVEVPALATGARVAIYDCETIGRIASDSPEVGYTVVILPAFTDLHRRFALEAPSYDQQFMKAIVGWVAGTDIAGAGRATPKVFAGPSAACLDDVAVAMHVELPRGYWAKIGIVNIFEPADGPIIQFPSTSFDASDCTVDGKHENIVDFLREAGCDLRLPLVSEFCGSRINVSIQSVDVPRRRLRFFAPVFEGARYQTARPVANYAEKLAQAIPTNLEAPAFTCNCVLNYLHGQLEGRRTGSLVGPMTFGEIGYQLLNQTLVYLTVDKRR